MIESPFDDFAVSVLAIGGLVAAAFGGWYRIYTGLRFWTAAVLALAAEGAAVFWMWESQQTILQGSPINNSHRFHSLESVYHGDFAIFVPWALILSALFAMGVGAKLYRALVLNIASADEKKLGWEGIRAWMRPMGLVSAAGIAGGAYFGMGWSPWGTAFGALAMLAAYPVGNFILHSEGAADMEEAQDISEERRRVLSLVESGKISAEDGAELLGALGQSRARVAETGTVMRVSGNARLMIVGAVLVLVGFCLPWFEIDLGKEWGGALNQIRVNMPTVPTDMPGMRMDFSNGSVPVQMDVKDLLTVRGGDIHYGLGWIILLMGLGAAVVPLLWPARAGNWEVRRAVALVGMLVGSVLLLYLVMGLGHEIQMGIILVMAGYGVMWVGAMLEYVRVGVRRVMAAG